MNAVSAEAILALPVRLHGIQLGHPVDLVLEPGTLRVVGLHVRCGDGGDRFVPLPAVYITDEEIAVRSALMLLDEANLAYYRSRGRTLQGMRGAGVFRGRRQLGTLVDLVLADDGSPHELVVDRGGARDRVPFADGVRVVDDGRRASAA